MQIISILIALLIIGLLVNNQLNKSDEELPPELEENQTISTPDVPTKPQDVPKFEKDMDAFVQDAAELRKKQLEEQE